jgi:hypothetical protein
LKAWGLEFKIQCHKKRGGEVNLSNPNPHDIKENNFKSLERVINFFAWRNVTKLKD